MNLCDREGCVAAFLILIRRVFPVIRLPLAGLEAQAAYQVTVWEDGGFSEDDRNRNCGIRGGDELMQAGLFLESAPNTRPKKGDFFAELFLFKRIMDEFAHKGPCTGKL